MIHYSQKTMGGWFSKTNKRAVQVNLQVKILKLELKKRTAEEDELLFDLICEYQRLDFSEPLIEWNEEIPYLPEAPTRSLS
jgi:hypothetical protein